jgi:hypothetical protein
MLGLSTGILVVKWASRMVREYFSGRSFWQELTLCSLDSICEDD